MNSIPDFLQTSPVSIEAFQLFGTPHLAAILLTLLIATGLPELLRYLNHQTLNRFVRYAIFLSLIISEAGFRIWFILMMPEELKYRLGLHLCGIAIFLMIFVMLSRNRTLFEITYFWALAGAPQAILTPVLGDWGYPHYHFFQFFFSHGLLIFAVLFCIRVENMRPRSGSVIRVFMYTNVYMLILIPVNYLLNTNYLYMCYKPPGTAMDFLGPWPWYILSLEILAFALFSLLYLPWYLKDRRDS